MSRHLAQVNFVTARYSYDDFKFATLVDILERIDTLADAPPGGLRRYLAENERIEATDAFTRRQVFEAPSVAASSYG